MAKLHFLHWLYCVKRRAQWIWILWTDLIMIAQEHSKAPTERIHSHSSSADPELPLHHPPSIPLSIAPFIPLLIPLSNSSLSFHLRSNNISNPYFQPAIPPMAISARALEIFNTLYPQFGWVILTKFFFFFFGGWRLGGNPVLLHEHMMLTGFSVFFLFFLFSLSFILSSFFFSPSLSATDEQTNPGEASRQWEPGRYCMQLLASFTSPLPRYLPSFVPTPQTCCLHVSASPLCVLLDEALYLDTGWQHGLARPSSIQNTLC